MNLTDTQKQQVAAWLGEGMKVAEIQKRLETDLGLRMTYMEVRFLLDDLKMIPKDPPPAPAAPESPLAKPQSPTAPATDEAAAEPDVDEGPAPGPGGVNVTVDRLARPGAMVSGAVTFSDGQSATWYLDEMGRLGLAPKQKGYRPSAEDVQQFQIKLQQELARQGF